MIRFAVPWPASSFAVGELVTDAEDPDDVAEAIKEHAEAGAHFTKVAIDQQPLGIPSYNKETAKIISVERVQKSNLLDPINRVFYKSPISLSSDFVLSLCSFSQ